MSALAYCWTCGKLPIATEHQLTFHAAHDVRAYDYAAPQPFTVRPDRLLTREQLRLLDGLCGVPVKQQKAA